MGRWNVVPSVLVCALMFLASSAAFAQFNQPVSTSLIGTVYAEGSAQRIGGASVALCDDAGNRLVQTTASDAGEFSFSGLRAERYILRVQAAGFATEEMAVDLGVLSQRGVSVTLKELPAGPAVPQQPSISAHELSMPEKARELLNTGKRKLYNERNASGALKDFQAAVRKAPEYYEAYYQMGVAYLALQKEEEAEKQFRKSAEISEDRYGDADIALGKLLLRRNEDSEGEALLRRGLAVNPQSWSGQVELGNLELSRGHVELALAAGDKAKSLAPQQATVYRLLALGHLKERNYSALVVDLDSYIRLDPDSPAGASAKELRAQVERQIAQTAIAVAK
jgi:tetratricopeptide (TPR) repeat protein